MLLLLLRLLLLLLLIKLLLVLLRNLWHRRNTRLEGLLLRRLAGETGILWLKILGRLLLRHPRLLWLHALRARETCILLVQRSLTEASGLRCKRLLLLLLAWAAGAHTEGAAILLLRTAWTARSHAVAAAEEGIGIGIHDAKRHL